MIISLIILVIVILLLAEIISYLFHRYLFHRHDVFHCHHHHRHHHLTGDDAGHDYLIMGIVLLGASLGVIIGGYLIGLPFPLVITAIITGYGYYIINWTVHQWYHSPSEGGKSWLTRYHDYHHRDPTHNYGILTPLADILGGTFAPPPTN